MGTVFYFSRWALAGARPMAVTLELSGTGWVVPKPLEIWRQVIETRTVSEDRGAISSPMRRVSILHYRHVLREPNRLS